MLQSKTFEAFVNLIVVNLVVSFQIFDQHLNLVLSKASEFRTVNRGNEVRRGHVAFIREKLVHPFESFHPVACAARPGDPLPGPGDAQRQGRRLHHHHRPKDEPRQLSAQAEEAAGGGGRGVFVDLEVAQPGQEEPAAEEGHLQAPMKG